MKSSSPLTVIRLCAFAVLLAAFQPGLARAQDDEQSREERWKKVEEAVDKGLPKTAIEELEPIIKSAMEDEAYPEAIKAIARKIVLEGAIQGGKAEEKITRLEAEIETTARNVPAMTSVMHAILANWYWNYFQQNRWRFLQRTETSGPPGDDISTWDLAQILEAIDAQFQEALSHAESLKEIPVEQYDPLLEKGNAPDSYRPTMFDFLAYEALQFYAAGEQAGSRAVDAFDLLASSPVFSPVPDFLAWELASPDDHSPTVRALRLYQELLAFHRDDEQPDALLISNLDRLSFGYNKASAEEKDARYKAALKRLVDEHTNHPVAALALHQWAAVLQSEGDLVQALSIAQRGAALHPDTPGGNRCANLASSILQPQASAVTERVWNDPLPEIEVSYKNLAKVYFRVVPFDWEARLGGKRYRPEQLTPEEREELLAKDPVKQWSADLPATEDYQMRTEAVSAPEGLAPGSYWLLSSYDEEFSETDNVVSFTDFWVSDLALVMRTEHGAGRIGGLVVKAATGEPVAAATVKTWIRQNNNEARALEPVQTNADGLFTLSAPKNARYAVLVKHGKWSLAAANDFHSWTNNNRPQVDERSVLFTDRSLYRPGQTVHYKGIAIRVDQEKDNYDVIPGRAMTVTFVDANGKEIAKHESRTNDYGSFSGSFNAPRDRLMGTMYLRVSEGAGGQAAINVEEYKRPKFRVELEAPETAPKLGGKVTVKGSATAYTGAAVNDAEVRYRVVREVRYPIWWRTRYWWRPFPQSPSQEIAHGSLTTGADGSFAINFTAHPDLSIPESEEPTFQFTVYADVTDTNGETRSDQFSVTVGYTALQASLAADDWLVATKPMAVTVTTQSLDGTDQAADGVLKIYSLKEPDSVPRASLNGRSPRPGPLPSSRNGDGANIVDGSSVVTSDPDSWPLGEVVAERNVETGEDGRAEAEFELEAGAYRAIFETRDRFGKEVKALLPLTVLDPDAKNLDLKVPQIVSAPQWTAQPGDTFTAVWGTGYDRGRAYVEVMHRQKTIQSYWTDASATQVRIEQAVDESMRGGFTVHITFVRENRAYLTSRKVEVPWTNKDLIVKWERFVSKLKPGAEETWTAVVTGPDAKRAVAEVVATLYDAALDAYKPHAWQTAFNVFRQDYSNLNFQFQNMTRSLNHLQGSWPHRHRDGALTFRTFPSNIVAQAGGGNRNWFGNGAKGARPEGLTTRDWGVAPHTASAADAVGNFEAAEGVIQLSSGLGVDKAASPGPDAGKPKPDLSNVSARRNLDETAFFFPKLVSNEDGEVRLEFTMPEALTEWKLMAFAHDRDLRSGYLEDTAVTSKDLMIQPNPPRFVRENDVLEFTVKVSNQSAVSQQGTVRLSFNDARTGEPADEALGLATPDRAFDIPAKQSQSFSWRIEVPDGQGFLTYKAVGSTGTLSDGEEGYLPVLPRRILVTESLTLPIRGTGEKRFEFDKLLASGASDTLESETFTVQMVSNPAWYAVMALPYLMEFPHECSEQVFNRLYANNLAAHIAKEDPKIRRIFDLWRGTEALDSPLEKNEDLKSVMLEETPWFRQAMDESQARKNIGILFEQNRLENEMANLMRKLGEMQLEDGAWPWFPGGRANDYITLYITTGFGRLRHLGVEIDPSLAVKSLTRLDAWLDRNYRRILERGKKKDNHLSPTIALYLYGRSFFLEDQAVADEHKEALEYFLGQAREFWLELGNRQSQAHLALALHRFGDGETPAAIMKSIKEFAVTDEELGMFWRDQEFSYWWYRAPIETQAMMIEAFDEVMDDREAVRECRIWLLKQKQTQDWKTTKATADAVYALLLRGADLLASDAVVEVTVGGNKIEPEKVEAGTGFYEERLHGGEITPKLGEITVKKVDEGVAWGSVHWQYLEDMSKVTPHQGTPLTLEKSLYTKVDTDAGPKLEPLSDGLAVGDELVVRLVLRVDRDMEYLHLKDQRGSGTEPVNVLSRYKYQDGLAYYESTRDTASHFFIDYLPKGVYVFEYSTRIVHKGRYQTGIANIQCMYAPEFNSHSESFTLEVK